MLVISIHGFRTLIKPGVWILGEKVVELIKKSELYSDVKMIELGYKNIIYEDKHGLFWKENGFVNTFAKILKMIEEDKDKKIVILGHSLGGWSAALLTQELNKKDIKVDILIQIDAMPLFKHSLVFTDKWVEEVIEQDNETVIKVNEKIYDSLREPIIKLSNNMIDLAQNLADPIVRSKIRDEVILSIKETPHLHQKTYSVDEVGLHYYYYSDPKAWSIVDKLVHIGTGFETKAIEEKSPNLINIAIEKTHLLIDDMDEIYDRLLVDLGVSGVTADLSFKNKIENIIEEGKEKIETLIEEGKEKVGELFD